MRSLRFSLATMLALGALAVADYRGVALDKVPKPVLDAVKKRFPKGELKEAFLMTVNEKNKDKDLFDVILLDDKLRVTVGVKPDGTLDSIERGIKSADLPKAVADALEAKYPKSKVERVVENIKLVKGKEVPRSYEVHLTEAGKKAGLLARVSPKGKITSVEREKERAKERPKEKDKE